MSAPAVARETSAGHPLTRSRAEYFGRAVRARRKALGLSQEQLAEAAGFDRASINRVEQAKFSPSLHRMLLLADALRTTLHQLLEDAHEEEQGVGETRDGGAP